MLTNKPLPDRAFGMHLIIRATARLHPPSLRHLQSASGAFHAHAMSIKESKPRCKMLQLAPDLPIPSIQTRDYQPTLDNHASPFRRAAGQAWRRDIGGLPDHLWEAPRIPSRLALIMFGETSLTVLTVLYSQPMQKEYCSTAHSYLPQTPRSSPVLPISMPTRLPSASDFPTRPVYP